MSALLTALQFLAALYLQRARSFRIRDVIQARVVVPTRANYAARIDGPMDRMGLEKAMIVCSPVVGPRRVEDNDSRQKHSSPTAPQGAGEGRSMRDHTMGGGGVRVKLPSYIVGYIHCYIQRNT